LFSLFKFYFPTLADPTKIKTSKLILIKNFFLETGFRELQLFNEVEKGGKVTKAAAGRPAGNLAEFPGFYIFTQPYNFVGEDMSCSKMISLLEAIR